MDTDPGPIGLTQTQTQRLRELGADPAKLEATYASPAARDAAFKELEDGLVRAGRAQLDELRRNRRVPGLIALQAALRAAVTGAGFVEVVTPHIISAEGLVNMGIGHGHPLREQVFWLEDGTCLRPMLAPNLYVMMRKLGRIWSRPFGIFEMGTCFRRDTKGSHHLNEFTMLNLVEVGLPMEARRSRLEELAATVMQAAGIADYALVHSTSEVYGDMLDVEVGGEEVCSASFGPIPMDDDFGITEPWVGLGFGLERLLMVREVYPNIERGGRSLTYVDGVRLNI
ncbi:MAG TPA: pyrrolysine--tRNA(Pyl) ligase large subunit [Thermoleophilia bacterium]|nr:pyrrolysine--tRNA(Pyl) ligase large subunit [Thermoleophilia bacterium]